MILRPSHFEIIYDRVLKSDYAVYYNDGTIILKHVYLGVWVATFNGWCRNNDSTT